MDSIKSTNFNLIFTSSLFSTTLTLPSSSSSSLNSIAGVAVKEGKKVNSSKSLLFFVSYVKITSVISAAVSEAISFVIKNTSVFHYVWIIGGILKSYSLFIPELFLRCQPIPLRLLHRSQRLFSLRIQE